MIIQYNLARPFRVVTLENLRFNHFKILPRLFFRPVSHVAMGCDVIASDSMAALLKDGTKNRLQLTVPQKCALLHFINLLILICIHICIFNGNYEINNLLLDFFLPLLLEYRLSSSPAPMTQNFLLSVTLSIH